MPKSEFSEDQFECNLICEISNGHGSGSGLHFFKPSRKLENLIGYDFAINTNYSSLSAWGVKTNSSSHLPSLPTSYTVPGVFVSSFIQCKVPFRALRKSSRNHTKWNHWNRPFYQYSVTQGVGAQQEHLLTLERRTKGKAVVRYASPCFYTFPELNSFASKSNIADNTNFVAPTEIKTHGTYTYIDTSLGKGFSKPENIKTSNYYEDISELIENQRETGKFFEHCVSIIHNLEVLNDAKSIKRKAYKIAESVMKNLEVENRVICADRKFLLHLNLGYFSNVGETLSVIDYIAVVYFIEILMKEQFGVNWYVHSNIE